MVTLLLPLLLADAASPGGYTLKTSIVASAGLVVGQPATLRIAFEVPKGTRISRDEPLTIKVSGQGVSIEKPVLHIADAEKPKAAAPTFTEAVIAREPGAHTLDLDLSFSVCTAAGCHAASEHRKATFAAK